MSAVQREGEMTSEDYQQRKAEAAEILSEEGDVEEREEREAPTYKIVDEGVGSVKGGDRSGWNYYMFLVLPDNETAQEIDSASTLLDENSSQYGCVSVDFQHSSQKGEAREQAYMKAEELIRDLSNPEFVRRILDLYEEYQKLSNKIHEIKNEAGKLVRPLNKDSEV